MPLWPKIELVAGDITTMKVDAIVNAAKPSLGGGSGVDGAIHRAAGPELLTECLALPALPDDPGARCATGDARITKGYNLPARHVIHTPGPVYRNGNHGEAMLLANCHTRALALAVENGCRTVAFPAISTGVYGYPIADAAQVALQAVIEFLGRHDDDLDRVVFVLFSDAAHNAFKEARQALVATYGPM